MIITIDGPAGSGKGTTARLLANKYGGYYINSGIFYRALAYVLNTHKPNDHDSTSLLDKISYHHSTNTKESVHFQGKDITPHLYSPEVSQQASRISKAPEIRTAINQITRELASSHSLTIVEGRDIGSVVFPHAELKFFLTASPEIRAMRIMDDTKRSSDALPLDNVIAKIRERDTRDTRRSVAPLRKPHDAIVIDNSKLSIEQTVEEISSYVDTYHRHNYS